MADLDFSKIEKTKFELSTRVLKPQIIFLDKNYDPATVDRFIKETGLDRQYLSNEHNWISYQYHIMFLEKMAQFTGNSRAIYDSGIYILSKESYGSLYSLMIVLKLFGTPKIAYKKMCEISSNFSNIGKIEFKSLRKHKILIKSTLKKIYKQTKLNCLSIKGGYAAIPLFWNLPPAKVKEIQCAAEGHESCVYEISWVPRNLKKSLLGLMAVLLLIGELVVFFFNKFTWLDLKIIFITGLISFILILLTQIREYQNLLQENKIMHEDRSQALAAALENSKKESQQLKEANIRIFEVVNKLTIINFIAEEIFKINKEEELITRILNIIAGCLNFDRACCLYLDKNFKLTKPALLLDLMKNRKVKNVTNLDLEANQQIISNIFQILVPRKVNITLIDKTPVNSILMPLTLRGNTFLFIFDNYKSQRIIKESRLYFFSSITNQIRLALENIYTARAAHNIISSIPSAILIFDKTTYNISYVNSAYLNNYRTTVHAVIGKSIMNLLKIEGTNRELFQEKIDDASRSKYIDSQELQLGNMIIGYTLFKMPVDARGNSEIGMVMKDITKQKEIQDQLLRSEKLAALGTLASGVAHEINNPLYGVLGTAEVIVDDAESAEIKKMAEDIIEFTMQVSDIVKDLSSYSRNIREEQPKRININIIIEEALRIIKYSPVFIDVNITRDFQEIPEIFALGGEISQIFMNLINNAVQAMDGKGELRLTTGYENNKIRIDIEDNGPGIPRELLTKIFDPFFTTKPAGEGTGLGLNIVYRLITKYNGYIKASQSESGGARFTVEFPVQEPI